MITDIDTLIRLAAGGAAVLILMTLIIANAISQRGLDGWVAFVSSAVVLSGFVVAVFGVANIMTFFGTAGMFVILAIIWGISALIDG